MTQSDLQGNLQEEVSRPSEPKQRGPRVPADTGVVSVGSPGTLASEVMKPAWISHMHVNTLTCTHTSKHLALGVSDVEPFSVTNPSRSSLRLLDSRLLDCCQQSEARLPQLQATSDTPPRLPREVRESTPTAWVSSDNQADRGAQNTSTRYLLKTS